MVIKSFRRYGKVWREAAKTVYYLNKGRYRELTDFGSWVQQQYPHIEINIIKYYKEVKPFKKATPE